MRGNAARAVLPALAVLALVGIVAIAATGSTTSGSGETRRPADALVDTLFSLALVALIPAAAILVWGLTQRKAIAEQMASGRYPRTGIVGFLVLTALGLWAVRHFQRNATGDELADLLSGNRPSGTPEQPGVATTTYEPEFAWIPVLIVLALIAIGVTAAFLASRRWRGAEAEEEAVTQALVGVLEDTLEDLRAEADPRRAVIAAYARLERTLAAHGLPRRVAETPEEYLARILGALEVNESGVRRLTDLFTRAKFSQHAVDAGMKEEAIDALVHVRDELRETRERAERAQEGPGAPDSELRRTGEKTA